MRGGTKYLIHQTYVEMEKNILFALCNIRVHSAPKTLGTKSPSFFMLCCTARVPPLWTLKRFKPAKTNQEIRFCIHINSK